ncbi:lisH domain-containing protein ARMC9-like [Daktulosphaira vitifoliae]|uniref:lisH domain-containing protein ARMC9-like n=1 Tax=Daktulosphaira vitifoliae TaxID=58002 RepID=UPI0021AAC8F3|nr:lisH domain-containing protein ARMC9-like [Daktulosphaira vitifoliae]
MDRLEKYTEYETKTLQHIYEFLLSNKLTKTCACFLEECNERNMIIPPVTSKLNAPVHITKDQAASIIKAFKNTSRTEFLKMWNDLPFEVKQLDEYRKLTFYLYVYYTIVECKSNISNNENSDNISKSSLDAFRSFLVNRGAEFSTENEFLPYFALPYVSHPAQHSSFQNLFKENQWCDSLNKRLEDFILDIAISTSILLVPSNEARKRKIAKNNLKTLYLEYKPLNILAAELISALENSIRGQAINLDVILKNCNAVIEINENDQIIDSGIDNEYKLSIYKIKLELRNGNSTKNKLLILQALRWRLTRSQNRTQTVVMIKKHDMLDLCKLNAEQGLMKWLMMTNGPHPLQQMISRLLNALASFIKGRKYLASSPFLIKLIVSQLISSQHFWDTITCNMLLGTLQKLSLRVPQRKQMIENGLATWLTDQLVRKSEFTGDRNKFEMYDLEYSLGLFANICKSQSAVQSCASRARNLLQCISVFVTTLDVDILPCLLRILYSILKNKDMINVAIEIDLLTVVKQIIEKNKIKYPLATEQLNKIKLILQNKKHPDLNQSSDEENTISDNETNEYLEIELDEDDPLKIQPNGEEFLATYKTENVVSDM